MAAPILIRLAGEPKGKGRPRFVKQTGRAFTPAATRSYEAALRFAAQEAMAGRAPLEGALRVEIRAGFPIPASWSKYKRESAALGTIRPTVKPDADNLAKMLDALNEVVWRDDKQAVSVLIEKRYSVTPDLTISVGPA
jgi:Holliday junction resolvase RusA-like endonuclease